MTNRECISKLKRIWKKWTPILGLQQFDVVLHFAEGLDEEDPDLEGYVHVSWEYMRADVQFFPAKLRNKSEEYLNCVVVHEACHILLKELQDLKHCNCEIHMQHEERVATMLERAFIRAVK